MRSIVRANKTDGEKGGGGRGAKGGRSWKKGEKEDVLSRWRQSARP